MFSQLYQTASSKPIHNIAVPTIGVAGVTIPGALDCINKINQKVGSSFPHHNYPNIKLDIPNFGPTHQAQNNNRWDIVENRLVASVNALAEMKADFVIIPANTVHKMIERVQGRVTVPVLNMLDIVAEKCQERQLKKVGILGTRWTMADHLYKKSLQKYSIEEIIPSEEDQRVIQDAIFKELIPHGKVKLATQQALLGVVANLRAEGCDGIVLACTELPLVLNNEICGILTLDTTDILAEAAVKNALALMQKPEDKYKIQAKL